MSPLISIVMPTLNGSRYIASAMDSILAQTLADFEVIVVDGGSTDGTPERVRAIADPRIRLIDQPKNSGRLPGALNAGFGVARGQLFTWAQDDDLYTPEALALMAAHLESSPETGMAYTGMWCIDEHGSIVRPGHVGPAEALWQRNPIGHCFLYRRSIAAQVGSYDPDYYLAEDFHYWARMYRISRLDFLPGYHYYHRLHTASLTMREYGRYAAMRVCARARRTVLGLGWVGYRRQLAAAYIEEGFAAHQAGDAARARRCMAAGLINNPAWARNRGVLAVLVRTSTAPRAN